MIGKLKSTGEITTTATSKLTKVTICNYNSYQDLENDSNKQTNKQVNNVSTSEQQQHKKERKKEEKNTSAASVADREKYFYDLVWSVGEGKYQKQTLRDFFDHWTETSPRGRKMRYEKEKTFDVEKRLRTWATNNYNKTEPEQKAMDTTRRMPELKRMTN